VRCYAPNGDLIGNIRIPETCANLCFGGKKRNRLFIAGSTSVYAVYVETGLCRDPGRAGASTAPIRKCSQARRQQ
jgi:hypothetical protein